MKRGATLAPVLLSMVAACAPQSKTVAKVSVGNTGCSRANLAVFNYQSEQRSWTAVCEDKVFLCSQIGGRATRCAPALSTASDPVMLKRARALRLLSPERAEPFITEDIMSYDEATFERLVALTFLASDQLLSQAGDVRQLVTPSDETLQRLSACPAPEPLVVFESKGKLRFYGSAVTRISDCVNKVAATLELPPLATDSMVVASKELSATKVNAWIAQHLAREVSPTVASSGSEVVTAPAPAPSAESTSTETELRALLDAKTSDVLACVGAPKAVIEATVSAANEVTFGVRGIAASDPVQGCVRAVLGTVQASSGPLVVMHLLRAPETMTSAAKEPAP